MCDNNLLIFPFSFSFSMMGHWVTLPLIFFYIRNDTKSQKKKKEAKKPTFNQFSKTNLNKLTHNNKHINKLMAN